MMDSDALSQIIRYSTPDYYRLLGGKLGWHEIVSIGPLDEDRKSIRLIDGSRMSCWMDDDNAEVCMHIRNMSWPDRYELWERMKAER